MDRNFFKIADIQVERNISYNKLWRSIGTLLDAGMINPSEGSRHALCFSISEKAVLDKFLNILDKCNGSQSEALVTLKHEEGSERIRQLEEDNQRMATLLGLPEEKRDALLASLK